MGLLLKLLAFPVMGPVKGLVWIAEKIAEQAENELYDPDKVRGKLIEFELRLDLGEITEEEYLQAEEILLDRLRIIRERQAAELEP
ncbi:MAG: gas vesicle protein GvpG [Anaerolineae bacterium]|nr:gas vesicle protein GvpG [Anaerolineae bacterium]